MSHEVFRGQGWILPSVRARRMLAALAVLGLIQATPARALLPMTPGCRSDAGGANDAAWDMDVTRYCVESGDGSPYELDTIASLDIARLDGAGTIEVCSLYNTDADAFADLAVCTVVKGATGNGGNNLLLYDVRLYKCTDLKADRCSGATLIPVPYGTHCEASQEKADPFPPPAPGPGSHYPEDTLIRCGLDLDDFGAAGTGAMPLDTCSYPSGTPDSDPGDCLTFKTCSADADCEDGDPCTSDTCDASGVCRYSPNAGAACTDGLFCNGDETCTSFGMCGAAAQPRDCDDGVSCTLDTCDEITDSCINYPRNSVCSDGLFCNGVEICDPVRDCQAGTPPHCGDGIDCTIDSCNEATDGCDHTADSAACSDLLLRQKEEYR